MTGLYIHIPFCLRKCPYCDFYSERYSKSLSEDYKEAVIRNLRYYNESYDTVYFGGGTPVLMAEKISEILTHVRYSENSEITVEANPCVSEKKRLETLINGGVNRISFGIQSMNEAELRFLGRSHTPKQAEEAVKRSYDAGFRNISADLMIGLPKQTKADISASIKSFSSLPLTHVSAYILKIEEATPFSLQNIELMADEDIAELYLFTCEELEKYGFMQYEISNFSKSGYESRHNLKYWRCEEYLGIGAAAHSYYKGKRFCTERSITGFINSERQQTEITDEICGDFEEYAMLKLRLGEGLSFSECKRFGVEKDIIINRLRRIPKEYYRLGDNGISLTREGFLLSNSIIGAILDY